MTAAMTVDAKDFHQALKEYAKVSSKDWSQIANDKTRDLLFKAGKEATVASAHEIRGIKERLPFLKMVAKRTALNRKSNSWKRDFARTLRGIIGRRVSATSYTRSGFYKAALRFMDSGGQRQGKQRPRRGKQFPGSILTATSMAKPRDRAEASASIIWTAANAMDARGKQREADKALQRGMRVVIRDMRDYLERKAKGAAKKYSAK